LNDVIYCAQTFLSAIKSLGGHAAMPITLRQCKIINCC